MRKNTMIDAYKGREGYIAYCIYGNGEKWKQNWANNTNELYGYKEQYGNTLNNYISMAVFKDKDRKARNVKEMVWLFIDIDCPLKSLTLEESQELATAILEREDLPEPTLIEFSGHGLQLFYKLKNATDIPLWSIYQESIIEKFKRVLDEIQKHTLTELSNLIELSGMHVDALKDPSRVMRVPDTANVKNKNNIVHSREIYKSDKVYTLEDLHMYKVFEEMPTCTPYNVLNEPESKVIKEIKRKAIGCKTKGVNYELRYYLETVIAKRIEDLETLIQIRNRNGITDGYRNELVFIYAVTLCNLGYSKQDAKEELKALNKLFKKRLSMNELKNCLNSCYDEKVRELKDKTKILERVYYRFKTKNIVEKLGITEEEQKELTILISVKEKNRRNWEKNGKKYNTKRRKEYEQATLLKRESKEKRNKEILELSKQGLTQREIATKYGIAQATVFKILKNSK